MPLAKKELKVESSTDVRIIMCHCAGVCTTPPTQPDQFFFSDDRRFSLVEFTLPACFSSNSDPSSSFSPPACSATHLQLCTLGSLRVCLSTQLAHTHPLSSLAPGEPGSWGNVLPPVVLTSVPVFVPPARLRSSPG